MILVTGATGTIGSHVARDLRDSGAPVRAFVRDPIKAVAVLGSGIDLVVGSFGDDAAMRQAMRGADAVFLACSNQPRQVEHVNAMKRLWPHAV